VGNAIKFSPTGARVLIRLQRQAHGARIIVSDNGPGVPERARATVFEPFYRASKGAPGSGLGLAIARELARQHGGDVLLLPSAEGACFALDLPLADPEPRASR
jgi:signal transduction histidine kinase